MVVEGLRRKLGIGLYTPAEAALYVRATPQAVTRWVHGTTQRDAVFDAQLQGDPEHTVTFLDLVQTLAIRAVRTQRSRLPLPEIREAIKRAEHQYDLQHPLARKHRLYWFDGGIVLRVEDGGLIGISNRMAHQQMMVPIVEPFMEELHYNEAGLADTWTPMELGEYSVQLNPRKRFGQPIIEPYGLLVNALADSVVAEGSIEAAADIHGVVREAVVLALKYRDSLTGIAA